MYNIFLSERDQNSSCPKAKNIVTTLEMSKEPALVLLKEPARLYKILYTYLALAPP